MKQFAKKYPWLITVLTAAITVAVFGVNCLKPEKGSIGTTIRFSWLIFVIPVITLISMSVMAVIEQTVNPSFASEAVKNLALTAGIGIFEEALFRGVVVVGLILTFKNSKHVFAITAAVSSLFFGFVHVMFDLDFSNGLVIMQCVLKTLEAASHGLLFLLISCKTKSLIGAVISHMLYDYVGIVSGCVMTSAAKGITEEAGGYVSTNAARGVTGSAILAVTAVIGIVAVVIILKKHLLKPEREAFISFITGDEN